MLHLIIRLQMCTKHTKQLVFLQIKLITKIVKVCPTCQYVYFVHLRVLTLEVVTNARVVKFLSSLFNIISSTSLTFFITLGQ